MSDIPLSPGVLNLIRMLIPYVRQVAENDFSFPGACCAETTAQIYRFLKDVLPRGSSPVCGQFKDKKHIWMKVGYVNVDFTAHQFPELVRHTVGVDGYRVLYGTTKYFMSLGLIIYPPEQCEYEIRQCTANLLGYFNPLNPSNILNPNVAFQEDPRYVPCNSVHVSRPDTNECLNPLPQF